MKKKLIISVILALVLAACGTGNTEEKPDNGALEKAVIASVEAETETSATADVGDSQADIDSVDTETEDITTTSQDMEGTDMKEAIECANLVGAKHSIPYHMAPGKDFDKAIAETFDVANRIIIAPGEELTLE